MGSVAALTAYELPKLNGLFLCVPEGGLTFESRDRRV